MYRTIALKPPACSSRSALRNACSRRDQGFEGVQERCSVNCFCNGGGATISWLERTRGWGSAHLGVIASDCNNPPTALDRPLTSCRGCRPNPPPCSPFFAAGATRYFSGSSNL